MTHKHLAIPCIRTAAVPANLPYLISDESALSDLCRQLTRTIGCLRPADRL